MIRATLRKVSFTAAGVAFALTTSTAHAQAAPLSKVIPLTFTGVVAADPTGSIQIRQPDGSMLPYAGPMPTDYPYKAGDPIQITMNATVPTQAYFDQLTASGVKPPVDGIYTVRLSSDLNGNGSEPGKIGNLTPAEFTGGLSSIRNVLEPNYTALSITYDSKTGTYALPPVGGGRFYDSSVAGAGFTYDPQSGRVSTCLGLTCGPQQVNFGAFALAGNEDGTSIVSRFSNLWNALGEGFGSFTLAFNGSWNLPRSGDPVEVPEPGMTALFGAAALVPLWRRRRALRKMAA